MIAVLVVRCYFCGEIQCSSLCNRKTVYFQKLLFFDTPEGISNTLRPHWSEVTRGRAGVVQAQEDMLEIVPPQTSKGTGVKMLLDHLNINAEEV